MRMMFIPFLLLASVSCVSQNSAVITLDKALANKMPVCGLIELKPQPKLIPDSPVIIITNCWARPQPKPAPEPQKIVNIENNFTCKIAGVNIQKSDSGVFGLRRISCNGRRCLTGNSQPLLVIDGMQTELKFLSEINPSQINSVEVLTSAPATALFGPDGANGALCIETRKSLERKFIIKDFLDGSRLAGATVSIISGDKKDTLMYVANDSGVVITDKLKKSSGYQMTVSAVGHHALNTVFENNYSRIAKEILLSGEIKTCPEVIISKTQCWKKITCYGYGNKVIKNFEAPIAINEKESFRIFPNPVSKGGMLNIKFNTTDNEKKSIRVLSLDGRILSAIPGNTDKARNSFQIQTDSRWTAGIYFVQLLYENGRVAASEKVIIQ